MAKSMYAYHGPVKNQFGNIVSERWYGETYAVSLAQAANHLCYQYKRQHGYTANAKFTIDVKRIRVIECTL